MGLIAPLTTSRIGVPFNEAYSKVERIQGDKNTLTVMIVTFANKESRDSNSAPVGGSTVRINTSELDGPLFESIYEWIKANQAEFKDATDA